MRPRKRSVKFLPRPRTWPHVEKPTLLGFVGYKVGMTHAFAIDQTPGSPTFGKEVFTPVTVIETPPVFILGIKAYIIKDDEPMSFTSYIVEPPKELQLNRLLNKLIVDKENEEKKLSKITENLDKIMYLRAITVTQPRLAKSLGKKKPEAVEIQISGNSKDAFEFIKPMIGKEITIDQVFKEGQEIDIISVTKGKGFQGAVKRFHVQELPRWHKHRKGSRKVGTRGPFSQSYTPQPGQMGFHRRTDYNKKIMLIGNDPTKINVAGGFVGYGVVRSQYIVVEGSVPGSVKRPLFLRYPIRKTTDEIKQPKVISIDLSSKQG
ncbi:50S ribosomal protein L3 [Sulfolobales archaeon HS-7]|nr:50S ribosomal protein L3 [Sulfolobales archaeon HS-7]